MAGQKHDKGQEEAYRRGYHQAVSEALRLLEASVEQQVAPEQILALFQEWEQKLATWRGALETGRLLDPPPAAGGPRLRLVEREDDGQEDEAIVPILPGQEQAAPAHLQDKAAAQVAVVALQARLQEAFADADFFVRASLQHGTARSFRGYQIIVQWTDGPSQAQVEAICGDLAQQVNISRLYSVEFLRQAATLILRSYGLPTEQLEIGVHESSGNAYIVPADWQFVPGVGHIDQVVYRQLKDIAQDE